MVIVTDTQIDPGRIYEMLNKEDTGSVLLHYAVVKSQAGERRSSGIRFEKNGDIESELAEIEAEIKNRWNITDILLIRRTGVLQVGELISLVAVSSQGSSDAFEACQYGLANIRKISSINKTELYAD